MGRIKSLMVKKAAKQLLKMSPEYFTTEFNHNKKILGATMPSKPIRNKIAGYIARLNRAKKTEAERELKKATSVVPIVAPQTEQGFTQDS